MPTGMTSICALLPLRPDRLGPAGLTGAAGAGPAIESLVLQTRPPDKLIVVLDGSDPSAAGRVSDIVGGRLPLVMIDEPRATLSEGLNRGLRAAVDAGADLVARMDSDDRSRPERIERQARAMGADPALVGLGTAALRTDALGVPLEDITPPTDPEQLRLQVLHRNPFVHGSMMLRPGPVLDAGGYDESLARAQDHDLWIRLTLAGRRLANLPEVLYEHRTDAGRTAGRRDAEQARSAARSLVGAWARLIAAGGPDDARRAEAERSLADALRGERSADGPAGPADALGLIAHLASSLAAGEATAPPAAALAAARRARVREVTAALAGRGIARLWLYPAGRETRAVLDRPADLRVAPVGLIDDDPARAGELVGGLVVRGPDAARTGDAVLIVSGWRERALARAAAPMARRGVRVVPLFGSGDALPPAVISEGAAA